ncbi:MAG TPA: hypothetical protein VJ574_06030 [Candidatus Bathyarchaeia archaeon]|nr:hypothetical protein [Candidatus Bathyarchaeia archaeon]
MAIKGLVVLASLMLIMMPVVYVSAEPQWGPVEPWISFKVTPSGLHIVKDPMFDSATLSVYSGWVIYVCTSDKLQNTPKGLDYSVTGKALTPGAEYDVKAYPVSGSSDYGIIASYNLGQFTANGNGEGKISGYYDLTGPAVYEWEIRIELSGSAVLQSHPTDPIGFFVIA